MWMCDRSIPQQSLCNELADLIYILPREAVVPWLRGFWSTMSREWTGIDVLRMEKFLLLVRRVVGVCFRWMKGVDGKEGRVADGSWDAERVDDVVKLLVEWPFALDEDIQADTEEEEEDMHKQAEQDRLAPRKIPVGMKLHVLDIWVDEAEKVGLLDEEDEKAGEILQRIVAQVDVLEKRTVSPAVRVRSKESLADDRLPVNKAQAEAEKAQKKDQEKDDVEMEDSDDNGSWDGFDD